MDAEWLRRSRRAWNALWSGDVSPWPSALFRVGVAVTVLVRTTDWLRPWIALDHHAWVTGLEYDPVGEAVVSPALHSPLVHLLPTLSDGVVQGLIVGRTALAVLLLLGVAPRWSAALLALVGYGLMADDRYRYFHHLHLLWLSCAWLAIMPSGDRLALPRAWTAGLAPRLAPRWPLQLARFQVLVVYAAAGVAKLSGEWLDGSTLRALRQMGMVEGPVWDAALSLASEATLARATCATEILLAALLAHRRTRIGAVAVALGLHAVFSASMVVSTFGASMALYLLLFLPWREGTGTPQAPQGAPADDK